MDEDPKIVERRKSERIFQSYPVYVSKDLSERLSQEQITGFTRNISSTGLSFLTDKEYQIGDTLSLQIDLPSSQHHLRVKVMHVEILGDSRNTGVAFLDMSLAHQKALMDELFQKK